MPPLPSAPLLSPYSPSRSASPLSPLPSSSPQPCPLLNSPYHPLQKRYLDAVPSIVPLLEAEQRATAARIEAVRRDLAGLNPEELKVRGMEGRR